MGRRFIEGVIPAFAAAICLVTPPPAHASAKSLVPAEQSRMPQRVNYFSVDGSDPLHPQTQEGEAGRMFAPIGLIVTNRAVPVDMSGGAVAYGQTRATGFLISPCYIMTNYHSIFGQLHVQPDIKDDHSIIFEIAGRKINAKLAAYSEYYKNARSDWAVMHLAECIGEEIGWLNLTPVSVSSLYQNRLSTAGYPADHVNDILWRQDGCDTQEHIDSTIAYRTDCAMSPGMSGSPIFSVRNGQICVVAIAEGEYSPTKNILRGYDLEHANIMVDVHGIEFEEPGVNALISYDIRRFGKPNPAFTTKINQCASLNQKLY